jgi:hypothetical protein
MLRCAVLRCAVLRCAGGHAIIEHATELALVHLVRYSFDARAGGRTILEQLLTWMGMGAHIWMASGGPDHQLKPIMAEQYRLYVITGGLRQGCVAAGPVFAALHASMRMHRIMLDRSSDVAHSRSCSLAVTRQVGCYVPHTMPPRMTCTYVLRSCMSTGLHSKR